MRKIGNKMKDYKARIVKLIKLNILQDDWKKDKKNRKKIRKKTAFSCWFCPGLPSARDWAQLAAEPYPQLSMTFPCPCIFNNIATFRLNNRVFSLLYWINIVYKLTAPQNISCCVWLQARCIRSMRYSWILIFVVSIILLFRHI